MPTPVSLTSNVELVRRRRGDVERALRPSAVNLIALPSRFSSTCRRCRPSSTTRGGTSGAIVMRKRSALAPRRLGDHVTEIGDQLRADRSPSASMSMRPASIFDRSSTSLIRSSRCAPHLEIASSASRCVAFRRAIALQQLRVADHAVERRAQLVAHVGEELALGARRRLGRRPSRGAAASSRSQPIGDVAQERAEEEARRRAASAR